MKEKGVFLVPTEEAGRFYKNGVGGLCIGTRLGNEEMRTKSHRHRTESDSSQHRAR